MNKLHGEVTLPTSSRDAERLIFGSLLKGDGLRLRHVGDVAIRQEVTDFVSAIGYSVAKDNGAIECARLEQRSEANGRILARSAEDFVRKTLAVAANGVDAPIDVPSKVAKELELELLVLRRMGISLDAVKSKGAVSFSPKLNRVGAIKYRLQSKNHHLMETLALSSLATGCVVELTSSAALTLPHADIANALGVSLSPEDPEQDEDELSRRLKRLKRSGSAAKEYRLTAERSGCSLEVSIPGDYLVGLGLAAIACGRHGSEISIDNVPGSESALAGFRLLSKMGANVEIRTRTDADRGSVAGVTIGSGELTGKKIGGDALRACPEAFFALAPLGMVAQDKTVIRDLPYGSSVWRKRISLMRHILESCGARIGELEDGLVVEPGKDLMYSSFVETSDELLDLTQVIISQVLPCKPTFALPHYAHESHLCRLSMALSSTR